MTTVYSWSSSSDTAFTAGAGTAPTTETAGSYGMRLKWAATTAVAWVYRSGFSLSDFGARFIYTLASFATSSHMIFEGMSAGPAVLFRVDLSSTGKLRIRNSALTQLNEGTYTHVTGTEYRFEIYRSGSTLYVKSYNLAGTLLESIAASIGTTVMERFYIGNNATLTGTLGIFTYDEILVKDVGSEVGAVSGGGPVASAGSDISTSSHATTTLNGSASTGSTWAWTLVDYVGDDPGTITITNASSKNASYTSPATMAGTILQFRITVDGTVTDDVFHTIAPHKEWLKNGSVWQPLYGSVLTVNPGDTGSVDPAAPAGWTTPLWADYFTADTLDTSKWWARNGKAQSPTNQQALYLASKLSFQDNMLHINVDREDVSDGGTNYKWTSGEIQSDGFMLLPTAQEWYLECRLKTNMVDGHSRGLWPALWLRNSPSVGEIDIMEAWGTPADNNGLPNTSQVTFWQNTSGSQAKIGLVTSNQWDAWETWAIHGDPTIGRYRVYRGTTLVRDLSTANAAWLHGTEYSSAFYVRLCVQVEDAGGYWGPADDSLVNTNGHYEFLVDYVRAYTR